jgi:hypothetical protein
VPEPWFQVAVDFQGVEAATRELTSLALIELEVFDPEAAVDLIKFGQDHTDTVPYDESYYDPSTLQMMPYGSQPTLHYRVAFYLHFYDPLRPLGTPWGPVNCDFVGCSPPHLRDKSYMYWR